MRPLWKRGAASPNPKGRPKGIVDRRVKLRELIEPHGEEIILKLIGMAKRGDIQAAKLLLDRSCPVLKADSIPVNVNIPAGSLAEQAAAIFKEATGGKLSTEDAQQLMAILTGHAKVVELDGLLTRIENLEKERKMKP